MYCLGPKVKVLTTLSDDSAIIGITNGYADKTLELIHDKGKTMVFEFFCLGFYFDLSLVFSWKPQKL